MQQKKKFYAVRKGRKTGIFTSWADCKAQIDGFPSAEYKGFVTREEAEAFLNIIADKVTKAPAGNTNEDNIEDLVRSNPDTAIAYVDGSFSQASGEYSCGAVLFYHGKAYKFSRKFNDPEMAEMRNVAGEIMGSVSVIQYCMNNSIKKLIIYHDYEGVAKWALGLWKANKRCTQDYASFCRSAAAQVDISFRKVKGHSGDKYNDMADKLAKEALGII